MDIKEAERKAIIDIIAEMQEKTGSVKCLEIEKEATKHGISKPTFYRRLTELAKEGILNKNEVSHRDIKYRVTYQHLPEGQEEVLRFKIEVLLYINTRLRDTEARQDELEVVKELGRWLGALSLYCLYKEIMTGYPYTDAVKYYLFEQPKGAPHYLRKAVVYGSKAPDILDDLNKLAKAMSDEPLGRNKKFQPGLTDLFEILQKIYPQEFDAFSMLQQYLLVGQASWPPEWRMDEAIARLEEVGGKEKEAQKKPSRKAKHK